MRNPDFELDESGLEMWSLFITEPDDMEVAADLLQSLLAGEFNSRDGMAYFLRVSARLLNKYKIKTKPLTLDEISMHAHNINDQLATEIDSLRTTDEYIKNINIFLIYVDAYLNRLPANTQLDEAVKNTIKYLINFVMFSIIKDNINITKNLILKFKKYFLPIYTQFFFENIKVFKIKNEFYRLYLDEIYKLLLTVRNSSLLEIQDKEILEIVPIQKDINEVLDSVHLSLVLNSNDKININDNFLFTMDIKNNSLLETRDLQMIDIDKIQIDRTKVIDSMSTILQSSPKEMLNISDNWAVNLYSTFDSLIETNDTNTATIIQNQFDRAEILDSVIITIS